MSSDWKSTIDEVWHRCVTQKIESNPDAHAKLHEEYNPESLVDSLIQRLWDGDLPTPAEIRFIIVKATDLFRQEPNILELTTPITIVGDIHGQHGDMLDILRAIGLPPIIHYLFLGDYVDRGSKSIECILLLCALKIKYPHQVHMLRGNHECMSVTAIYGFRQEVLSKYRSEDVYNSFMPLFNSLPISAIINNTIFCVHGGLSRNAMSLADINEINRFMEIPVNGALSDLLWADPSHDNTMFTESDRNTGCRFGGAASELFCRNNKISLIVRAHQLVKEGFEYCQENRVLTVFSAPNYESTYGNKGAILNLDEESVRTPIKFRSKPAKEASIKGLMDYVY